MSAHPTRVWLAAAENGSIPGAKVGGVGDVIRDLPVALADRGCPVRVVIPASGSFHLTEGALLHRKLEMSFAGKRHVAEIYRLASRHTGIGQFVIHHKKLMPGKPGQIYHADDADNPFATDSGKYAFFCAALVAWVKESKVKPDVLHLHDWHTGLVPFLLAADDSSPARVRTVFTIHNIAYQGIRPLEGSRASMQSWFPGLDYLSDELRDPRYHDCVNFMAAAMRLSDSLNTVSPTYAREILRPSDPDIGFIGGEGLEGILTIANEQGRLAGVLNGCMYPDKMEATPQWSELVDMIRSETGLLNNSGPAGERLAELDISRPSHVLLSIGRTVTQKAALFLQATDHHPTALEAILSRLGDSGLFIMLGSGEAPIEEAFADIAKRHHQFLYLRGYAENLSGPLYAACDLFVMPSSFEPCGISQMLAMRAGQPCVVHGVGGLKDTVQDGVTGFVFEGADPEQQAEELTRTVSRAINLREQDLAAWMAMQTAACSARFEWKDAAEQYITRLYKHG